MLPPGTVCSLSGMPPKDAAMAMSHPTNRRALVFRLSRQALEALEKQSQPNVEVDLGSQPGIYINDVFFPVDKQGGDHSHDLYLRIGSNPTAALKPFASITGKIQVESTLDDDLRDRLQQTTQAAHNKKQERGVKLLDTPPTIAAPGRQKKKNAAPMFMKSNAPRPSDSASRPQPSASTSAAPALPPIDDEKVEELKSRFIRAITLKSVTAQEAIKLVEPDADAALSRQLRHILDEICESSDPSTKNPRDSKLQLKPEVLKPLRPFEMLDIPQNHRVAIARAGRTALHTLGYKESDPEWIPFVFTAPGSSSSTARPTPARDTKDKKPKTKAADSKVEPQTKAKAKAPPKKDALPPPPSPSKSTASTSSTAARRPPPGSGYQRGKGEETHTSTSRVKSERVSLTPDLSRSRPQEPDPVQRVKKLRGGDSDIERERSRRLSPDVDREGPKRKKPVKEEDDDDYGEHLSKQKRRKTADGASTSTGRREVATSRPKAVKQETSPSLPPAPIPLPKKPSRQMSPPPQARASSSKPADKNRTRRRDLTEYTSSEDEGEIPLMSRPLPKSLPAKPPPPKRQAPVPLPSTTTSSASLPKRPSHLSEDQLRRRQYRKLYSKYISAHNRLCHEQNILKDMYDDLGDQTSASFSDDDGDAIPMDFVDLMELKSVYAGYEKELGALRRMLKLPAY